VRARRNWRLSGVNSYARDIVLRPKTTSLVFVLPYTFVYLLNLYLFSSIDRDTRQHLCLAHILHSLAESNTNWLVSGSSIPTGAPRCRHTARTPKPTGTLAKIHERRSRIIFPLLGISFCYIFGGFGKTVRRRSGHCPGSAVQYPPSANGPRKTLGKRGAEDIS